MRVHRDTRAARALEFKTSRVVAARGEKNTKSEKDAHLRNLHLAHEANAEVLEDDAVGRGEEREDVRDEVLLVVAELLPVLHVVAEVDLLGCERKRGNVRIVRFPGLPTRRGSARYGAASTIRGAETREKAKGDGFVAHPSRTKPRPSCTSPRCPRT